jgi:DNA primase
MDAASEVKSRLNIEDVIGEYITLKRTGRNWKGLSPFSSEKTPSLVVSPDKQIWKDFSSGKGGSVIDFVMESEGLEFREALELLARKAGVDLEQYSTNKRKDGPSKERLYDLLEKSTKFYQVQLANNKSVLDYVINKRKFSKDTVLDWRLGYSPNTGHALVDYLKNNGFTEQEIKLAGLISSNYRSAQDMFRQRLMIPLSDPSGRVIGFTARLLDQNPNAPKYINTPQSPLYDKSQHVYGFDHAKNSIRKSNYAVICEGNLDVIASHQAGVKEVVATAGTALTLGQLKLLYRLTNDVRLAYDRDKAGLAATERAIPIASKAKISLSIIDVPSGKDPDDLIKEDPKLWQEAVNKPSYALDWLMNKYKTSLDITSAKGKREYSDILLPVVRSLDDPVEVDHYINQIAKDMDVSREALETKFSTDRSSTPIRRKTIKYKAVPGSKNLDEYIKIQDKFLSLMLMRPTLREFIDNRIDVSMMPTEDAKVLIKALKDNSTLEASKLKIVKNVEDYVKIESLLYEELYQGLELNELHDEAARLQADLITKYVKHEKEKISADIKNSTSDVDIRSMQEKDRYYNQLLKEVKGEVNA